MLALVDFAVVQADIHYFIQNPNEKKGNDARATFIDDLASLLIYSNWEHIAAIGQACRASESSDDSEQMLANLGLLETSSEHCPGGDSVECLPIHPKCFSGTNTKKFYCQVCTYENRGLRRRNVVCCLVHSLMLCIHKSIQKAAGPNDTEEAPNVPLDPSMWCCNDKNLSCWEKVHSFYVKNNLWNCKPHPPPSSMVTKFSNAKVRWSVHCTKQRTRQKKALLASVEAKR